MATQNFTAGSHLNCTHVNSDAVWLTARNAASSSVNDDNQNLFVGLSGNYFIGRTGNCFDISVLPGGSIISGVKLFRYRNAPITNDDSVSVAIVDFAPANPAVANVADYNQYGSARWSSDIAISGIGTGAFHFISLNATGIAACQADFEGDGIFKCGTRMDIDIDNSIPSGSNFYYNSDALDAGQEPYLEITYGEGTTFTPKIMLY